MMEELQDALEDAQYINAILFDEEGGPRPLKAWKVPTDEQLSAWRSEQLQEWSERPDRNYASKPFDFLWTISTPLGLFIFSSFLKEVTNDYLGICFVEEVLRWRLASGPERVEQAQMIMDTYLMPYKDPDSGQSKLPSMTLIEERNLEYACGESLLSKTELADAVSQNMDQSCSKCCIGLDGPVRDSVIATIRKQSMMMEESSKDKDPVVVSTTDDDELSEEGESPEEGGNPEDDGESPEGEASENLDEEKSNSSLHEEIPPPTVSSEDGMFDLAVQIILDDIRQKYWDRFIMGDSHCNRLTKLLWNKSQKIRDKDFHPIRVLGRGGFGLVTACRRTTTGKLYAMKVMDKKRIKLKKSQKLTINERDALASVDSPFIVNLKYSFQSKSDIFLVLDLMIGGDLSFHLQQRAFSKDECLYYSARIMYAMKALHDKNYVYRDLKPENCLLSSDGRIKITDLGLTTKVTSRLQGAAGTRGYWAPEMLRRDDKGKRTIYDQNVDWFSFGCVIAEMISGKCPFRSEAAIAFGRRNLSDNGSLDGLSTGGGGNDYQTTKVRVNMKKIKAKVEKAVDLATLEMNPEFPSPLFSEAAADICRRLLEKNPRDRLGCSGCDEIIKHPWFDDIDMEAVYKETFPPPFIPLRDINTGTQSEIGQFERSSSKLDEQDEAFYYGWEYVHPKVFDEEVLSMLIFERNSGKSIVPIMAQCCCTIS